MAEAPLYLIVGNGVRGGRPSSELSKLDDTSPDIDGKMEFEHIMGAIADNISPASNELVFPNKGEAMLEEGFSPEQLFI